MSLNDLQHEMFKVLTHKVADFFLYERVGLFKVRVYPAFLESRLSTKFQREDISKMLYCGVLEFKRLEKDNQVQPVFYSPYVIAKRSWRDRAKILLLSYLRRSSFGLMQVALDPGQIGRVG